MGLPEAIFLSALAFSFTAIFLATKDRWNWKKIILAPVVLFIAGTLAVLVAVIVHVISDKTEVQGSLLGLTLENTKADIKFLKGEPTLQDEDSWTYQYQDKSECIIKFEDENIRYIFYEGRSGRNHPELQGIGIGSSTQDMLNRFGDPDHSGNSDDNLIRLYWFDQYHVFFWLERDRVVGLGIFNPTYRNPKTSEESDG